MSDFGMEAEAQEYMTLWNSKILAGPFLPDNGELLHGIDPTVRRQHRYGDDSDEQSAQLDYRSPDSKGHESDPVDDESDESGTYLGLWKKQMAGHDGCPASEDTTSPDTMALAHEDMPIRPGIGPGSYAKTFEELLENTLRGQEVGNPAGVSIADLQLISAEEERRSMSSKKCQDRTCADTKPGGGSNRHGLSNKEGITLQVVCSDDGFVGQKQGLFTTADAQLCSLGSTDRNRLQRATQALQPFLPPLHENGCFEVIDCGHEKSIREQGDKAIVVDPKQVATVGPAFRGEIFSQVADLTEVEGTMRNLLDGTASYPISSCEDSVSLDEKASYPVSSCEDSVSLEEKESVENEFDNFCSLNHIEDYLLKEGPILDKKPEEQTKQHSPKELHLHQLVEREVCNAEVETEYSNTETVRFEDILALLKLGTRKGCQATAPILNDKVCERDAMDEILTNHQADFYDESNSCHPFQVIELARNNGSETGSGTLEVQLPCVHVGTSVRSHDVCALDLEHMHLSGSAAADSEVLCVSDNNVNGFCLDIDSYPSYSMDVVYPDESVHSALMASVKQQHHQRAVHGADASLQLGIVTGRDGEPYQECGFGAGASKKDLDQQAFDTLADRRCQVDVSDNGQAGLLGLDTELPLRACLVPLRDLMNRPRERGGGRHVGPDKHKAVLLYKNPLWTDESFQDLPLLMSNCQLQDESKSMPISYGDSAGHSESSTKKVDRRRGWNIDASVSVNALRMASLLLPDEELQETQQNVSEECDGRPCRKRCKGLLYDETCGSEPWHGMCEGRMCEDDCENCDASWLSRNSLSDGYVTEIIVGNEGEGTIEEKVDFLNHETNLFEIQRRSTDVVQCDRSRVFAAHVVPEEEFDAQQLSNTYDAADSVDELISVVEQENQVETAIGSERERSSGSGWFFPLNECVVQTKVPAIDCAKSARATWRESVEKSENLLQFSYVHNRKALEHAISPDSGERLGYAYQQQAIERPEEAERGLSTTGFATMSGYHAAQKAYGRYHVNTNSGRQLGRAATSSIRDVHSCYSSSTASPKSVMQADHILEVENDFGDCAIKDNHSAQKAEVIVLRKANGVASGQSHLRLCSEDNCIQCEACSPSCVVQSTSGLQDEPGSEEAEVECVWKEDNTMEREVTNGQKQPTTNIENEQLSFPRSPIHQKGNEPVGETEKLLAAFELEEFRFLERRVRKEAEGIQTKVVNSSSSAESRLATTNKGPDTHFCDLSSSPNVGTRKTSPFEENGGPKQVQQPPSGEPKYKFDDKSTWSEEHRQAKHSQRQDRLASPGPVDIDGSRAPVKQETAEQCPRDPMSKLVRSYFLPGKTQKVSLSRAGASSIEGTSTDVIDGDMVLQKKVEALEAEIVKFQTETRKAQRVVKEHEDKASQLCCEKASWEQKKNADMQKFQEFKNEQMRKVKKHHQMLEKLSQEMLQLPTKKERNQIEDLKAALSEMKEEHAKKETRWRLTEKRLRGIIDELTGQSRELQEEIKRYEARLHQQWQAKDSISASKCERGTSIDYNVLSISMREMSHHISMEECTSYQQTTGLKMCSEVFETRHEELGIPDSRLGPLADLSTREMMAMHETSQSKGRRRIDSAALTELTEAGCAVYATGTISNKSNHNCFIKNYEPQSGKGRENGKILQNNEPREYQDMTVGQSTSGPKTMLLQASEQGHTASGSQCLGSAKTHQTTRNSETSAAKAVATLEPLHQQSVNNQNFNGSGNLSSRGNMEDRQHELSSNDERSSLARDEKQDEEHVSVDDCVYFANGDIKNTLPDGSIEYYYSEVDTWHTTKPSGVEIFYFPDYQVEEHWPNGQKKIISPDGSFYVIGGD